MEKDKTVLFGMLVGRQLHLLPDVPVAQHDELLAGQSFQSHRTTGVKLVGRDADFRAQPILETVGKSR